MSSGLPDGACAISIIGTPEVLEWMDEKDTTHYLPDGPRVLNLEFDDITEKVMEKDGFHGYGITDEQAGRIVRFLETAISEDLDIYIHCRAGRSRSQAIVRYVKSRYPGPWETNPWNPDDTPNYYVLGKLRKYEEKQGLRYT
jgi:predicted protein tyrosine phosphatase